MSLPNRPIKVMTIALLVVLLCLPVYGPDFFFEYLSTVETNHAGFVCDHASADSGHESQDGHQQIDHCHDLDAPCDTASGSALDYSPDISTLTSSDKGALLDGYGAPFEIPPEHHGYVRTSKPVKTSLYRSHNDPAGDAQLFHRHHIIS